jgi:hypothetical protein
VSRLAEIAAFVRLADGGLSPEVLARVVRRRWPEATDEDLREAVARAASGLPDHPDDRAAMDAAAATMLGRKARRRRQTPPAESRHKA